MKKASIKNNFEIFNDAMEYDTWLIQTILNIDNDTFSITGKEENDKKIKNYRKNFAKKEILEAYVFKIDSSWQFFIRNLFVDCLSKDLTQYAKSTNSKIPKHLPWQICRAMVNGMGYFDFKNISNLKNMGKKYLIEKNNPFKNISESDGKKIDDFYTIRNFITHRSAFSSNRLVAMYKNRYKISKFKTPGDFLISTSKGAEQIRFSEYIETMLKIATDMKSILKK